MTDRVKKKKVIILGAGFSYDAGIPLQNNLLGDIFKIEAQDYAAGGISLRSDQQKLKGFLKNLYGNDPDPRSIPLEDLYTMIDIAITRQRNIDIFDPSSLFKIRESLDRLILYTVNKDISEKAIDDYIEKVKKLLKTGINKFISLNWDYLLEQILVKLGYQIDYGAKLEFSEKKQTGKEGQKSITVLKPHGSLNWRLCPICETIFYFLENENIFRCPNCEEIYEKKKHIIESYPEDSRFTFEPDLLPLLVSPTFMKNNIVPQLNIIMQLMYRHLSEADQLIFIGYSLPISDHDIRDYLIKAYSLNQEMSVKVILKSKKKRDKETLKSHYNNIFAKANPKFLWGGF